ncbi:hypothetical protein BaRGS_00023871 [Batillaria attramentaria]|uniref:Amino acid transporter n=1 Tax=Batillaria attramentaria TaxID=370345 RepID=A0ABD0KCJ1_9CAEN
METSKPPSNDVNVDVEADSRIPRSDSRGGCNKYLKENAVLLLTLIGVVLGFAIGFGIRELKPSKDALMWIGMPGELFLRMLNLMVVPLIVSSVISGSASLDPKSNGKISLVAFTWITYTETCEDQGGSDKSTPASPLQTQDIFADLLRNIVPSNIVEVGFRKAQTKYSTNTEEVTRTLANGTQVIETIVTQTKSSGKSDSVNVIGLIFVAAVLGIAANRIGKRGKPFVKFFVSAAEIVIVALRWFFWTSPLGVASLIAKAIAGIDDLEDMLSLLLFLFTRRNPIKFHISILRPYFIGFASTSTAVALPEMLYCCEVKNGIDRRVARFAVPFSVTLSANGSAVFIVSAAIFIGQYIGYPLTAGDVVLITVLAAVSVWALPSVPSSSIVSIIIILTALNIPSAEIALLFAVEWFLDRIRSGCNVISHCYCAAVTLRFTKAELDRQDKELLEAAGDPHQTGETNLGYEEGTVTTRI